MKQIDILIFGGGIAGLWTLARLRELGYNALLLETEALGAGQTIKSQGIIHGGLKYAIGGQLNQASNSLLDMPTIWLQCLTGTGEIDLTAVTTLADGQLMWSANKLTGAVATLFASNALKSHVAAIDKQQWPAIMHDAVVASKIYKLEEPVLDVPSLLAALAKPLSSHCLKIDVNYHIEMDSAKNIKSVTVTNNGKTLQLCAQRYIFTAGIGNAALLQKVTDTQQMQRRPLQMVIVKSKNLLPLYGHCIGLASVPRITVTSHLAQDGIPVWYLGGKLAEHGIDKTSAELISLAKQELTVLFPKLDLSNAQFASFFVDRAEAKQDNGTKPNSITMFNCNNYITGWPTKLAFAPLLAQQIINNLTQHKIVATYRDSILEQQWPRPNIAKPIWDQLL